MLTHRQHLEVLQGVVHLDVVNHLFPSKLAFPQVCFSTSPGSPHQAVLGQYMVTPDIWLPWHCRQISIITPIKSLKIGLAKFVRLPS